MIGKFRSPIFDIYQYIKLFYNNKPKKENCNSKMTVFMVLKYK